MDKRQEVIDGMNKGRAGRNQSPLTPRQEHLVREFTIVHDDGTVEVQDRSLLSELLKSNSV